MQLTAATLVLAGVIGASLLVNGDFEQGLRNWTTNHMWYEEPKGAGLSEVVIAEGEGHDGSNALKLISKGNRGIVMQVFPAYPGKYRVTGWIKCQGLGDAKAGVLCEWMSRDNKWLRGDWAVEITGDQDWQRFDTVVEAHPDTRSVHFDLLVTSPNNGTVWFDNISCERVPGDLPTPTAPTLQAGTPKGREGCLEVTWDPASLSAGTVRLLIYCEERRFETHEQLLPKAVAESDEGKAMIWCLATGRPYYVAARAVNADMQASALSKVVRAVVEDRQGPRPGWIEAVRLRNGKVRVSWWPHVLDLDVKTVHFCIGTTGNESAIEHKVVDVEALYRVPRPLYCTSAWLSVDVDVPAGTERIGVWCTDKSGNRSAEVAWATVIPALPEDAPLAPCVLSTAPPVQQVPRDAPPPPEAQRHDSFTLWAMRGESEGFQVLVWPEAHLHNARVRFEPLISEDGKSRIGAEWLAYHFVDYVKIEKNSRATPKEELVWVGPAEYPDELSDEPVRDLPPGQCQPVFVRVTAPRDLAPGLYRGNGYLETAEGRAPFEIALRVSPVELPGEATLKFVYWFSWGDPCREFGVEQYSEDGWRVLRRLGELMRAYRQNSVVVPWSLVQSWRLPDGALKHDFRYFDRFIQTFRDAGVDALFCISHVGARTTGEWTCPTMSSHLHQVRVLETGEERRVDVLELLPAIQGRLEELGILERSAVHVADEPIPDNVDSYRQLSAKVKAAAPKLRRIDAIHVPDLIGSLEVWVPQLNYFEQWLDKYQAAQAQGNEIWFYVAWVPQGRYPNRMIDSAAIKPRVLHWLNFMHNTSGYLHWALNHWHIPLTSLESPGDQYICWPSKRFIADSSLRYEAEREGLEDCQLMFMLRSALERRGLSREDAHRRVVQLAEEAVRGFQDYTRSWAEMESVRRRLLAELEKLEK